MFDRRQILFGMGAFASTAMLPARSHLGIVNAARVSNAPMTVENGSVIRLPFGTAVRPDQLKDGARYAHLVEAHCAFVVPEYHSQWSAIEWRRGDPWFGDLDAIAGFARANGMTMRGHSLIWEQMTPDWARSSMAEPRGWDIVHDHFSSLLTRYDTDLAPEWIVVNECIDTEQGHHDLRRTSFQRAFGNDYVRRAFETAHAIAPEARLFINEYSLEYDNPVDAARRGALLRLVERLRSADVPVHGVGIQAHLELAKGRLATKAFDRFLHMLGEMGMEVAITELDVLEDDRTADLKTRDQRVADATKAFLDVAAGHPHIRTVATWGLSDQDSWLQDRDGKTKAAAICSPVDCGTLNRGLPYAGDYRPKHMAAAVFA